MTTGSSSPTTSASKDWLKPPASSRRRCWSSTWSFRSEKVSLFSCTDTAIRRRSSGRSDGAATRARRRRRGGRLGMLRDGRALRLREGTLRSLHEDGGAKALPGGARGGGEG